MLSTTELRKASFRDDITFPDKRIWGEGDWVSEPDEVYAEHPVTGHRIGIRRAEVTGALCGYVGVGLSTCIGDAVKNGGDLLHNLDVYGEVTYARCIVDMDQNRFTEHFYNKAVIGFDCAHFNDYAPALHRLTGRVSSTAPNDIMDSIFNTSKYKNIHFVLDALDKLCISAQELERTLRFADGNFDWDEING